jgi:hypothetical protein
MPGTPTPILGLAVPTVGGDNNTWGGELNGDLAILDNLGAATVVATSISFTAAASVFPEVIYRVTTGAGLVTATLPAPSSIPVGKIFTFKKVDAGTGQVLVSGPIDGSTSWTIGTQFSYVRVANNGSTYDVIGNN